MDDDVLCEPEVVIRLTAFANRLTEPAIVGGQMLNLLHPSQLHVSAEYADLARMIPGQPVSKSKLQRRPAAAKRNDGKPNLEEKRLDAGYNGWWSCLIPSALVEAIGYPLPFFFQWDDVEYGYRARAHGYATVTLPGAGLWHADFHWKDWDEWHRYFNMRNAHDHRGAAPPFEPKRVAGVLAADLAHYLVGMQYGLAATLIKAIEDFLRGPEILADGGRGDGRDPRAARPGTRRRSAPRHRAARAAARSGRRDPGRPGAGHRGLVLLKRVDLPAAGQGPPARRHRPGRDARWWHVSLFDTAVVTDAPRRACGCAGGTGPRCCGWPRPGWPC